MTIQFLKTVWMELKEYSKYCSMQHTGPCGDRDNTTDGPQEHAFAEGYQSWTKGQLPNFIDETRQSRDFYQDVPVPRDALEYGFET